MVLTDKGTEGSKRALITGVSGQIGGYLAIELLRRGYEVFGMIRGQNNPKIPDLKRRIPSMHLLNGDLLDYKSLSEIVNSVKPHHIYNLAAMSFVPLSWEQPELTMQINCLGPMRLLEVIRASGREIKFYQASSSEMYGATPPPQNEESNMVPQSPYGVSKLAAHKMCKVYRESFGMPIFCGICFNTESLERPPLFVTRKITKAAARIKCGLQTELVLGNLEAKRDWQWAGDAVVAMVDMMEKASPDDYVIASGESHSVREFADLAFSYLGLDYKQYVKTSSEFIRPIDVNDLCGDSTKLRLATGWTPSVSFEQLVTMMVDNDLELSLREQLTPK